MKVLIFGAGSTGRGHLGVLLYEYGIRDLVFVEKNQKLVDLLNKAQNYKVRYVGNKPGEVLVDSFKIYSYKDMDSIFKEFLEADLVITAVIAENLKDVALVIKQGLYEKYRNNSEKIQNIVACENHGNASSYLKELVFEGTEKSFANFCDMTVGFPDAMISRVVPVAIDDPLVITAENYNEWVIDALRFKGKRLDIPIIEIVNNLPARLEKKLWIHNGGHATVAYAGFLKGYRYIHEAVADCEIAKLAWDVMTEIGNVIIHKHGFDRHDIEEYKNDLVMRGSIAEIKDEITRAVSYTHLTLPTIYSV